MSDGSIASLVLPEAVKIPLLLEQRAYVDDEGEPRMTRNAVECLFIAFNFFPLKKYNCMFSAFWRSRLAVKLRPLLLTATDRSRLARMRSTDPLVWIDCEVCIELID